MLSSQNEPSTATGGGLTVEPSMKAVLQDQYGDADVLSVGRAPRPQIKTNQVLVQVHASAMTRGDVHTITGRPYLIRLGWGVSRPKSRVPGMAVCGVVVSAGAEVTRFKVGDAVFGELSSGAFAEFVSADETQLALKPRNLSFEEAAAVPWAAMPPLHGLRNEAKIKSGDEVLINGASGATGSFAIQIAKSFGANVTAVCRDQHAERLQALGADRIINYEEADFTQESLQYSIILDWVGNHDLSSIKRVLKPDGVLLAGGAKTGDWIGPIVWVLKTKLVSMVSAPKLTTFLSMPNPEDLEHLTKMVEDGQIKPSIGQTFSLSDIDQAMRWVAEGHAAGQTVIKIKT